MAVRDYNSCHNPPSSLPEWSPNPWRAERLADRPNGFTHLSHDPYLTQPILHNCEHCHRLDASRRIDSPQGNVIRGAHDLSDFTAFSKQIYVGCHTQSRTGNGCLKCHNHHITEY